MDLEEFRRSYMHMESIGNSPGNFFRRAATLGKSIGEIGPAIKKDKQASKYRYALRQEAKKEFKENGISFEFLKNSFLGRPKIHGQTSEAISRTGDAAVGMAMSVNELGQTAQSIVGTNGRNMYGGQDLEKGIHFALLAKRYTSKVFRMPGEILNKAERLINTADDITRKQFDFGQSKDKGKGQNLSKTLSQSIPRPAHDEIGR